ncbi:MAG: DUF3048 domain-containing protein [Coriobacteriia bacterium]|nr:DUF3048 domain-containing protein [Coriobacteriia bacterium]MCL2745579.1 DUF3048 domain-containing protein [Coriobacteriia bacterium]MCL2870575.1 DUF3048 domain-containing protein [Coriobacteriia bacterium]
MSRKSILWIAVLCSLVIAFAGLAGCRSKDPVVVTPPAKDVEMTEEPEGSIYWPLTGLEAENPQVTLGRTLSVKIDNHPQSGSKVGINSADVVFETLAEGGITRFNAVYQSDVPEQVMPVRSARDSDLHVVSQFGDSLFFYSGGNANVLGKLRDAGVTSMAHGTIGSDLYGRYSGRSAPHNLFVELAKAYEVATSKGFDVATAESIAGLEFSNSKSNELTPSSAYRTATEAHVPFSPLSDTRWTWDSENKLWLRAAGGVTQYDGASDEQISADNVVVMWARHSEGSRAGGGTVTYDIDLVGGGNVAIFSDGKRFDGTWEGSADAPPVFKDAEGNSILLTPGRTWISVVPLDQEIDSDAADAASTTDY